MKTKFSYIKNFLVPILDVLIVFLVNIFIKNTIDKQFLVYIISFWILIALSTKYYQIDRFTSWSILFNRIVTHLFIFTLSYFSYFGVVNKTKILNNQYSQILIIILMLVIVVKIVFYIFQKQNRSIGNSSKKTILFGDISSAKILENLFKKNEDLGYVFLGFFSDKIEESDKFLGDLNKGFEYIVKNNIDEIFCDPNAFSPNKLSKIRKFTNANEIEISYIPENKAIYSKDLVLESYGTFTLLKTKKLPFEKIETHIIKRVFDVFFSIMVFVLIFSWLLPILAIIIKLDSKGPIFFKQLRDGKNGKQFYCYKLRSMKINADADKVSASKNDERITKVGAFLRKSSLDELPQFINVFLGNMSVVGPRPHMNLQTKKYEREVANYLLRHEVKPGITGLAQISGYRGEVIENSDIQNRVRLDIFYIENWTFALDLKIIVKTLINVFAKEEKAY